MSFRREKEGSDPSNSSSSSSDLVRDRMMDLASRIASKSKAAAAIMQEKSAEWGEKAKIITTDVSAKASAGWKEYLDGAPISSILGGQSQRKSLDSMRGNEEDSKKVLFGLPLAEALERTRDVYPDAEIPAIVARCIEYVEVEARDEIGVYRLGGSTTEIALLKSNFSKDINYNLLNEHPDPNAVCSVLKAYLRELPDPILTTDLLPKFQSLFPGLSEEIVYTSPTNSNFNISPDSDTSPHLLSEIRDLCSLLPACNIYLLKHLMQHLDHIQERSHINKMTVSNLAVIFSPTLQINSNLLRILIHHRKKVIIDPIKIPHRSKSAPNPSPGIRQEKASDPFSDDTLTHTSTNIYIKRNVPPAAPSRPFNSKPLSNTFKDFEDMNKEISAISQPSKSIETGRNPPPPPPPSRPAFSRPLNSGPIANVDTKCTENLPSPSTRKKPPPPPPSRK